MATRKTRSHHSVGFYRDLNDIGKCFVECKSKRKRKTLSGLWKVERIVSSRKEKQEREYLIKWQDWPMDQCTWEPESNLGEELIRNFDNHRPSKERIEAFEETFKDQILSRLKSSCMDPKISVHLGHDVWRFLFKNKCRPAQHHPGWTLLEKDDFGRLNLPTYWWYAFDQHGQGQAISFPIRVKPILTCSSKRYVPDGKGKVELAPRKPVETISLYIARCQRSVANI